MEDRRIRDAAEKDRKEKEERKARLDPEGKMKMTTQETQPLSVSFWND